MGEGRQQCSFDPGLVQTAPTRAAVEVAQAAGLGEVARPAGSACSMVGVVPLRVLLGSSHYELQPPYTCGAALGVLWDTVPEGHCYPHNKDAIPYCKEKGT